MPLSGTLDLSSGGGASTLAERATERVALPGCEILHVIFEMNDELLVGSLPPALHPVIPPILVFSVTHVPESEVGPFTLAEVRVGCRAVTRPRGFLRRAYCDNERAIAWLRSAWGYPVELADVRLKHRYDRAGGSVVRDGATLLEVGLLDPEPISGADIQYMTNLNAALVPGEGGGGLRLVQVDVDHEFRTADRGRPSLAAFDAGAWLLPGARATFPVSASLVTADVTMRPVKYIYDPSAPLAPFPWQ